MSAYMNHELLLFFCSVCAGFSLLFAYDWLRILRRLIPHSPLAISATDFVFWLAGGVYIFSMMYRKNDGIIRSYAVLGILLGMAVYHMIFSTVFVDFSVKILGYPIKIVKLVTKRLLFAVGRCRIILYSSWGEPFFAWCDRRKKSWLYFKGRCRAGIGERLFGSEKKKDRENKQ